MLQWGTLLGGGGYDPTLPGKVSGAKFPEASFPIFVKKPILDKSACIW